MVLMTENKPNILLVVTDQQRTDTLGFMGKAPCRTPNMDRLAREGISFDRALCTGPLCLPSRASLFTGKYPHQVDMMMNSDTLQEPPVLTDTLRKHGYHTAYAGKWHLEPAGQPKAFRDKEKELGLDKVHGGYVAPKGQRVIDRWFDVAEGQGSYDYSVWCEENGLPDGWGVSDPDVRTHRKPSMTVPKTKVQDMPPEHTYDAWVTDIALRFLDERPQDKPFFLVAGYFGPHPPFLIPEPYYSLYDADDIPEPPNFGPQPNKPKANKTSYYHQLWQDHGDNWDAWKKSMAVYWGYCTMMDDLLGRLLAALENEGILDDTLVIFTSDHGEMLGSHGLWHKMMPYEECLRVPMLMRLPGAINAGIRSQANVSLIDIPTTMLSIIGEDIPSDMLGCDLTIASSDGSEFQEDAYRFAEHKPLGDWHQTVEWRLVTDNKFKYVWNQGDLDELYDLQSDPHELLNLINNADYIAALKRLSSRLDQWMKETDDPLRYSFENGE
jgi:arylsulfatase A-like enzyme